MKIPAWFLDSLGKEVSLTKEVEAGNLIYPIGYSARLISIQAGGARGPYVTVALDSSDEGWEENLPIDGIEPKRQ